MTTIAARTFPFKFLRERSFLQPFSRYFPRCKLSSNVVEKEKEITNENSEYLMDNLAHPDFFQVHNMFTVEDLFKAKVHLGHKEGSMDNRMSPFVFGSRMGHLIIDLDQTAELLREALNFTAHIAYRDGIILFVSKNPQTTHLIDKTAKECNEFSHTRHWRGGTFTDATRQFKTTIRLPDLCILFHTLDTILEQHKAITHSAKMCIPTVGIVDTNCNPNLVTYPVPGNDDSPDTINFYCKLFKEAIMRGKRARMQFLTTT